MSISIFLFIDVNFLTAQNLGDRVYKSNGDDDFTEYHRSQIKRRQVKVITVE